MESVSRSTRRATLRRLAMLTIATLAAAGVVAVALSGPSSPTTLNVPCASRVIVLDTSSGNRSPLLSQFALQAIEGASYSAIVCGNPLSTNGVAGGGQETPIITTDDLAGLTPVGPTPQVRASRFGESQRKRVDRLVVARLDSAYRTGDPAITSVPALYESASQQASPGDDILIITDGVNQDSQVNLNQPLAKGEGDQLAKEVQVGSLRGASVTLVGIAQLDSSTPPPSAVWPAEVLAFNTSVCHESRAMSCRLFGAASVSQALDS